MVDDDITDDEQSTAQKKYVSCLQCKFLFNIQVTATWYHFAESERPLISSVRFCNGLFSGFLSTDSVTFHKRSLKHIAWPHWEVSTTHPPFYKQDSTRIVCEVF